MTEIKEMPVGYFKFISKSGVIHYAYNESASKEYIHVLSDYVLSNHYDRFFHLGSRNTLKKHLGSITSVEISSDIDMEIIKKHLTDNSHCFQGYSAVHFLMT